MPFNNHKCRFVDHDIIMCFHGGGVGHKAVCCATDYFLDDWDPFEMLLKEHKLEEEGWKEIEVVFEEDSIIENIDEEEVPSEASNNCEQESQDHRGAIEEEEQDYRYVTYDLDKGKLDDNDNDNDGWRDIKAEDAQNLDVLGPEVGEGACDELEDLGFGDL